MLRKIFLPILFVVVLGACAPSASYWSEAQSPKTNRIETVRLWHDMQVPASGALSAGARAELDAFLARHDVGDGDDVTVIAAAGRDPGPLADYLRRQGFAARTAALPRAGVPAESAALPVGGVRLLVERYLVTPPNCPDWRKPGSEDYANGAMSNLGCANTANLGLMIADPRDLIQGRRPGDADGTASAAAVQRYRTDKVKALPASDTTK